MGLGVLGLEFGVSFLEGFWVVVWVAPKGSSLYGRGWLGFIQYGVLLASWCASEPNFDLWMLPPTAGMLLHSGSRKTKQYCQRPMSEFQALDPKPLKPKPLNP